MSLTEAAIRAELAHISDPDTGLDLIAGNNVQAIGVDGNNAAIALQWRYPARSAHPALIAAIESRLKSVLGATAVAVSIDTRIPAHKVQNALSPLPGVKNIIAVASGKGGVGKSTTAVNLALALVAEGAAVGILDADIHGPSIPMMLGITGKPDSLDGKTVEPKIAHGLQAMSIGLFLGEDTPTIWRGPMTTQYLQQLLTTTRWQDLDYLIIDLPPGTGDVQLSMLSEHRPDGVVLVSTPQDLALIDAARAGQLFEQGNVPIIGLVENMAGITEILFGFRSPLTDMLYEWRHFLTLSVGSTLATLRQLAHTDRTAACRLGWFIDRRMQQYLVLCAGVDHEEEINPSLLDFRTVRQQLEDGAFVFPACDFLRDKLGNSADSKYGAPTVTPSGSTSRTNRRAPPADEVINSQKDLFPKDPNDNWQVYLDHVRSGPVPNMCCRWHLNGKCRASCFLEWIKQCRARMRRPTNADGPGKKPKLGTSESAYSRSTFVAAPSTWSTPSVETLAWFSNRTGQPAGSSPRPHNSRQDDSPFRNRRLNADDTPARPTANPTTPVRG
mgnify:CR=1 FL=1